MAEGDLTHDVQPVTEPVEVRSSDELGRLSATFNEMLGKMQTSIGSYNAMRMQLGALVRQVSDNAGTVSATSQQMATTSSDSAPSASAASSTRSPASPSRRTSWR